MALTLEQMAAGPKRLSLEQMAAGPKPTQDIGPPEIPPITDVFKQGHESIGPLGAFDVFTGGRSSFAISTKDIKAFPGKLKKAFQRGSQSANIDFMWNDVIDGRVSEEQALAATQNFEAMVQQDPIRAANWASGLLIKTAGIAAPMVQGTLEGFQIGTAAAATAAIAGQAGPQVLTPEEIVTVPGAFAAGTVAGSIWYWSRQGRGSMYREARMEGIDPKTAGIIASIAGPIYGAIEHAQVRRIPGLAKIKGKIFKVVLGLVKNVGIETAEEGAQKIVSDASVTIGKLVDGKIDASDIPSEAKQAAKNALNEMKEAIGPMSLLQLPGASVGLAQSLGIEIGPETDVAQPDIPPIRDLQITPPSQPTQIPQQPPVEPTPVQPPTKQAKPIAAPEAVQEPTEAKQPERKIVAKKQPPTEGKVVFRGDIEAERLEKLEPKIASPTDVRGIFFSTTKEGAQDFADMGQPPGEKGVVGEFVVNLKNPASESIEQQLLKELDAPQDEDGLFVYDRELAEKVPEILIERGFDGIIREGSDEVIAFSAESVTQPPTPKGEKATIAAIKTRLDAAFKAGDLDKFSEIIEKDLKPLPPSFLKNSSQGIAETLLMEARERKPAVKPPSTGKKVKGRDVKRPRTGGFVSLPFAIPGPAKLREGAERAYQKYINRFASIENVTKKAQALGMEVKPGENPALRARSYLGIGRKVESMLETETFKTTPEGEVEVTGEGLKPILDAHDAAAKKFEKNRDRREKDFNDYLIAQRTVLDLQRKAFDDAKQNIASPRQVSQAKAVLAKLAKKYDISVLRQSAERLYEYQKRILHLLVDAGNLSQKQFDQIVGLNQHYIPFDRVIEEFSGVPSQKGRFSKARAPVSRIKGSDLEVQNPIESIIKNTYAIVDRAERNTVALSIAKLGKVLEDHIKPVHIKMVPIRLTEAEGDKVIFRPSAFAPRGNIVEYFDKGKRKFIEVTPNLFSAMTGMNEAGSSLVVKIFAKPAHWLRVGATITPEFMVRNVIRDQFTALMQTSHGFIPFLDSIGAIADVMGKTDVYHEWLRVGGAYAGFVELNRPALQKALKELRGRRSFLKKLNIISHAQDLSQLFEQATRVAVFQSARVAGKTGIEAGFISRESTIDFARRGSSIRDVNRVLAFFNAGLQGLDKTIRNSIQHPYSTAIKGMAAITIPSLLLYLRNREEDDFKQIPQWQKDLFWLIKIKGNWWRIPKPFLYGQIFGSLPERFFEYLDTKDKKAFDGLTRSVLDSVSPISGDPASGLLMTAVKPIIENATNHNFFLDRPIVSQAQARLKPSQQFNRYTTESAKLLGEWFNYSPAKIENLVRGWFGGTGSYGLEASDMLINAIRREAKGEAPKEFSDFPLVKGFAVRRPLSQPADLNRFYEERHKITQNTATHKNFIKEGKRDAAVALMKEHPEIGVAKRIEQLGALINKDRQRIVFIEDSNKTDAEKRRTIDQLEKHRLKVAQNGLEIIEDAKKGLR